MCHPSIFHPLFSPDTCASQSPAPLPLTLNVPHSSDPIIQSRQLLRLASLLWIEKFSSRLHARFNPLATREGAQFRGLPTFAGSNTSPLTFLQCESIIKRFGNFFSAETMAFRQMSLLIAALGKFSTRTYVLCVHTLIDLTGRIVAVELCSDSVCRIYLHSKNILVEVFNFI